MDPKRAERRLAAVMFTDIVGYTALMAGNEARALKAKAQHRALVRPLVARYHGESIEARARELFKRAVKLDPQFGDAYAGLAYAHFREGVYGWSDSPEQSFRALSAAAEKAVTLDEFSAQAHHALGHAFAASGQADRMLGAFHLGVELNPNDAMANSCYGSALALVGRSEEAIAALKRAMALSPRDPWGFEARIGMA